VDLAPFQHFSTKSQLGGIGEEGLRDDGQGVVEKLGIGAVHEREQWNLALTRVPEKGAVLHRPPQNRSTARATMARAISVAAARSAVSSREMVWATTPSVRKSERSCRFCCSKIISSRFTSRKRRFMVTTRRYCCTLARGSKA